MTVRPGIMITPITALLASAVGALVLTACASSGGSGAGSATTSPAQAGTSATATSAASGAGTRVTVRTGAAGSYLADAAGRTVYMFASDTASHSTCDGSCTTYWLPVTTSAPPTASGAAKAADLSTIHRADGTTQVSYGGHPLYYFKLDAKPGDILGQGSDEFGAKWWLVAPSGRPITASTPATSGAPSSSASAAPGGGGGW